MVAYSELPMPIIIKRFGVIGVGTPVVIKISDKTVMGPSNRLQGVASQGLWGGATDRRYKLPPELCLSSISVSENFSKQRERMQLN